MKKVNVFLESVENTFAPEFTISKAPELKHAYDVLGAPYTFLWCAAVHGQLVNIAQCQHNPTGKTSPQGKSAYKTPPVNHCVAGNTL